MLLKEHPDVIIKRLENYSYKSSTASILMKAIKNKENENIILNLIEKEKDINYKDEFERNSLFYAIRFDSNENIIRKLIRKNIEIDKKDKTRYTPLFFLIKFNPKINIIKLIID